jgi:hypothetical protein
MKGRMGMSKNPNVTFEQPEPVVRSLSRVQDDQGNVIDISVTGPENAVRKYLESTAIRVEVGPPDAFKLRDTPQSYDGGKEDAVPVHQGSVVEIDIQVAQAKPSRHALYLDVDDPSVPAGCSHVYRIGATNVSANCYPSGNDPDIVLLEWLSGGGPQGVNWARRSSSAADPPTVDGIPNTAWQSSGWWQLWIFDKYSRDCSYALEGIFIQDPYPLTVSGRPPV